MNKIKRVILVAIPMSICNFRCHYCYLSHRNECYQNKQIDYKYSPEYVGNAFSVKRLGGICYFNFTADGETLLVKDIDKYIYEVVKQGHYVEIVTNLTITPMLEKILSWEQSVLKRITFKCSFHYLELVKHNLLDTFVNNVHKILGKKSSANMEMVTSDEYIPYIDEIKKICLKEFGALPHLTIARDDKTKEIGYLTNLQIEEYNKIWSQFDSDFWKFKTEIFLQKRNEFCYAGDWSLYVNLENGNAIQCYCTNYIQNIFENLNKDIVFKPIGKCKLPHCYNGHLLITLGCIPKLTQYRYGDIRDRQCVDKSHWLQPELKNFFNSTLSDLNDLYNVKQQKRILRYNLINSGITKFKTGIVKLNKLFIKNKGDKI